MPSFSKPHFIKLAVSLAAIIFLCSKLIAQTLTGEVVVSIYDKLGGLVTDAEVILKISDNKSLKAFTNEEGAAKFKKLADGDYEITINKKGFQPYKSETISVRNGQIVSLKVLLDIAVIESTANVDENNPDNPDPERFGGTRNLSQKEIDSLPDNPEDMELVLRQLAGQTITGKKMPITVNGFPGGQLPPKAAIKQIRINQNVFSARYEGSSGGGIEIFTKSGLEKFSGGGFFDLIDSRFNAANPFLGFRPPSQFRGYGGFL